MLDLLSSGPTEYSEIEFLDDNRALWGTNLNGINITGPLEILLNYDKNDFKVTLALGNPITRASVAGKIANLPQANIIHSSAYLARSSSLGEGNTICAQAVINSNAVLANHVLVNNAAVVEHDSFLSDFVTVCPGALVGGRVDLSTGAFIGSGATILPRLKVGAHSILAAGSVLTASLPDNVLAMGCPARIVKEIGTDYDWRKLL